VAKKTIKKQTVSSPLRGQSSPVLQPGEDVQSAISAAMTSIVSVIVVTDLDGTFLNHHNYSYEAALPAVDKLSSLNIPIIYCSSKTRSEILLLRQQTANMAPFIVENGAAICAVEIGGHNKDIVFGRHYKDIRQALVAIRKEKGFSFKGFGDMGSAEIAARTGLSLADAELAREREFSEPLIWQDSEENLVDFLHCLSAADLTVQEGGRFLTVAGDNDKGRALDWLRDYYQQRLNNESDTKAHLQIIALGDSPNDETLLNGADIAVIVHSEKSEQLKVIKPQKIIRTKAQGAEGWCSAIMGLLAEK